MEAGGILPGFNREQTDGQTNKLKTWAPYTSLWGETPVLLYEYSKLKRVIPWWTMRCVYFGHVLQVHSSQQMHNVCIRNDEDFAFFVAWAITNIVHCISLFGKTSKMYENCGSLVDRKAASSEIAMFFLTLTQVTNVHHYIYVFMFFFVSKIEE